MKLRKPGGKSGCLVWMFPQCIGFPSLTIPVDLTHWQKEDMGDFQYRHFPIFNRGRLHFTGLKHLGSLLQVVKFCVKSIGFYRTRVWWLVKLYDLLCMIPYWSKTHSDETMANNPEMLTERELEEVTAVFKSFETGMREATIHPKVYPPMLGHDKKTKLCIRVSHFYTFFELSLVLLTTQAHGL